MNKSTLGIIGVILLTVFALYRVVRNYNRVQQIDEYDVPQETAVNVLEESQYTKITLTNDTLCPIVGSYAMETQLHEEEMFLFLARFCNDIKNHPALDTIHSDTIYTKFFFLNNQNDTIKTTGALLIKDKYSTSRKATGFTGVMGH